MSLSFRRLPSLVAGLALVAGCSGESTTSPQLAPAAAQADLISTAGGVVNGLVGVTGLQRTSALAAPISVKKTIGVAGGTLSIASAGVTVTVPAGALSKNTVITMTARQGTLIAYDFAPHGITFDKPLVFTQKLSGTNATPLNASLLQLGYYSDPSLLNATGGLVSELISGTVNLASWTFTSSIKHFSGYVVAMGRSSAGSDE